MLIYRRPETRTVQILSGQTTSAAFEIKEYMLAGVLTPDALTGTALTFQGAVVEAGDYEDVYDSDGNQVSLAAAANRAIGVSGSEADALAPWQVLKLVSNASEGANRTFYVALK